MNAEKGMNVRPIFARLAASALRAVRVVSAYATISFPFTAVAAALLALIGFGGNGMEGQRGTSSLLLMPSRWQAM